MPTPLPRELERWLRAPSHPPVLAEWVPGLTELERQALHAVGGVARGLIDARRLAGLPQEVRQWISAAAAPPAAALASFRVSIARDPDAAFASLYSSIVSREHRRQLGTFFTPSAEVKLMLDLWAETEDSEPSVVVDVGAGVGVFTAEAAKRWPTARVVAVDINPVTLGLLAVRLFSDDASDDAADLFSRVELVRRDYTEWFVSSDAPKAGRRLILGNPPYTRAQLLSRSERERLGQLTEQLCGSRASLSTIITALSLQRLGPTDGLSLLLPAQWLESQYAIGLRGEIWKQTRRRVELRLVESEDLFGGAQVDAVALVIGAERPLIQSFRIARWRNATPKALDRSEANPVSWRRPFDNHVKESLTTATVPLSSLAEVHRGVATGSNATFVLSNSAASALPNESLTRVITRLNEFPEFLNESAFLAASSRAAGWLLTTTENQLRQNSALRALVAAAEKDKIHERVLCARRSVWYDLTAELRRPDVLIGAMTQNQFKLVTNDIGAAHTNNLYGLTWHAEIARERRTRVLDWLRSEAGQAALAVVARRQGAGLMKLEPGGLRKLPIPTSVAGE